MTSSCVETSKQKPIFIKQLLLDVFTSIQQFSGSRPSSGTLLLKSWQTLIRQRSRVQLISLAPSLRNTQTLVPPAFQKTLRSWVFNLDPLTSRILNSAKRQISAMSHLKESHTFIALSLPMPQTSV